MKEFFQLEFANNTLEVYLEVIAVILVAWLIKKYVSKYVAGLLFRALTKAGRTFHKKAFLELVATPLESFIFLLIIIISLDKLKLPSFFNFSIYRASSREIIDAVANTLLIVLFI